MASSHVRTVLHPRYPKNESSASFGGKLPARSFPCENAKRQAASRVQSHGDTKRQRPRRLVEVRPRTGWWGFLALLALMALTGGAELWIEDLEKRVFGVTVSSSITGSVSTRLQAPSVDSS